MLTLFYFFVHLVNLCMHTCSYFLSANFLLFLLIYTSKSGLPLETKLHLFSASGNYCNYFNQKIAKNQLF